jgi:hypothetical protein
MKYGKIVAADIETLTYNNRAEPVMIGYYNGEEYKSFQINS